MQESEKSCPKESSGCAKESSAVSVPLVHHQKKKKSSHYVLVSSSDSEADTLKDRFWRDLEGGVLPQDLSGGDLYSSVYLCYLFKNSDLILPESITV